MKRIISILLVLVFAVACIPFAAFADDELRINFMKANTANPGEGTTTIYTYSGWGEELCKDGLTFEWCAIAVFDYDETTGGYKVTATYERQPAKPSVKIPEKGFAVSYNMGNDWPALFAAANGSEWFYNASALDGTPYRECPNYVSAYNESNGAVLASLKNGDIFYLVGCDLNNASVKDNGNNYWEDGYESMTYLTSVKPEMTDTPEEPSAPVRESVVNIFKADPEKPFEGATVLYSYIGWGNELCKGDYKFGWTSVVVFDFDEDSGGFKATKIYDLQPDKDSVPIPEKGFALTYNKGNDWPTLFASATGDEWFYNASSGALDIPYSECPNFITAYNEANAGVIGAISAGDIFYLVGCNLNDASVTDNGKDYWEQGYESYTYLTNVKPEDYEDPFDDIVVEVSEPDEGSEPAAASSEQTDESKPDSPKTGDAGMTALAVICVIALGAAAYVKKRFHNMDR